MRHLISMITFIAFMKLKELSDGFVKSLILGVCLSYFRIQLF